MPGESRTLRLPLKGLLSGFLGIKRLVDPVIIMITGIISSSSIQSFNQLLNPALGLLVLMQ
jgi:hypothetical protein